MQHAWLSSAWHSPAVLSTSKLWTTSAPLSAVLQPVCARQLAWSMLHLWVSAASNRQAAHDLLTLHSRLEFVSMAGGGGRADHLQRMGMVKADIGLALTVLGLDVILGEVDTVWMQNPMELLEQCALCSACWACGVWAMAVLHAPATRQVHASRLHACKLQVAGSLQCSQSDPVDRALTVLRWTLGVW